MEKLDVSFLNGFNVIIDIVFNNSNFLSLMYFNSIHENPFGFSTYVIMPGANNDSFISYFPILIPLFFVSYYNG